MYLPRRTISSMVTSFNSKGELNLPGLLENLEFQKKAGIESVCLIGGTGEPASLTQKEKFKIMETIMDNAGELNVIFGAIVGTPEEIKTEILKAKEVGASAVMVMPPPFIMPSEKDVELFFRNLADLDMPLVLFNTPGRSAFNMSESLILELSKIEQIRGIKEASGDMIMLQNIIENCDKSFSVLTGFETLYFPSLILGAVGSILASAAVIPEAWAELDKAIAHGDIEKARRIHYGTKLLDDVMYKASHPAPLKYAMSYRGLPVGKCRPPFTELDAEYAKEMETTMKRIERYLEGMVDFVSDYPM